LSVRIVIDLVSGKTSNGRITFCTRFALLRMLFMDLLSASWKARKGMSPQYRYRPKFNALSPVTSLNLIPTISEKTSVRSTIMSKGLNSAHKKPR
jgi:hypothetical protein